MIHQWIGAVDEKQVDHIRADFLARRLNGGFDIFGRGIVILHRLVRELANRCHDVGLGHDFDLVAQSRCRPKTIAKDLFDNVGAIDVGQIHRGDALFQTGFNLGLNMRRAGVVFVDAPRAIDNSRKTQVALNRDALHQTRSPTPRGVAGVLLGTRP